MDGNRDVSLSQQAPGKLKRVKELAGGLLGLLLVFGVLFGLWHWPTVVSVSKPMLISINPGFAEAIRESYSASDNFILYPSLGISVPMTETPDTSPLRVSDWGALEEALRKGVNLSYEGDSFDKTNFAYVTGHSSESRPNPYSSAFAALGQAKIGDELAMVHKGKVSKFVVVSTQVVNPQNIEAFSKQSLHPGDTPSLALVTCWPVFTTRERLVVIAELKQ